MGALSSMRHTIRWKRILEVLVISALGWLLMFYAAASALGRRPAVIDFAHWDSFQYMSIASDGYQIFPCTHNPVLTCGNAAWQPLYPMLMRFVSFFGIPLELSGLLITALAGIALLWVISASLPEMSTGLRQVVLFSAVVFPGATWTHAVFPMSLVLLFGFLAVRGAYQQKSAWLIGTFVALAILSHSSGFVIMVAVAAIIILSGKTFSFLRPLQFAVPIVIAVLAWLGTLWISTGTWQAWWLVQQWYYAEGQGIVDKVLGLVKHLASVRHFGNDPAFWPAFQTWIVIAMIVVISVSIWRHRTTWLATARDYFVLFMLGMFPFVLGGQLSISRNESQIVDARSHLPIGISAYLVFALALSFTYVAISRLYFLNVIL